MDHVNWEKNVMSYRNWFDPLWPPPTDLWKKNYWNIFGCITCKLKSICSSLLLDWSWSQHDWRLSSSDSFLTHQDWTEEKHTILLLKTFFFCLLLSNFSMYCIKDHSPKCNNCSSIHILNSCMLSGVLWTCSWRVASSSVHPLHPNCSVLILMLRHISMQE